MTTVPKDQMGPLLNTGGISKKSAVTGKGQVNTLPPPTMIGREPLPEMTAEGPTKIAGVPLADTK